MFTSSSFIFSGEMTLSSYSIIALRPGRFTATSLTPVSDASFRSTFAEHPAHIIPNIAKVLFSISFVFKVIGGIGEPMQ